MATPDVPNITYQMRHVAQAVWFHSEMCDFQENAALRNCYCQNSGYSNWHRTEILVCQPCIHGHMLCTTFSIQNASLVLLFC